MIKFTILTCTIALAATAALGAGEPQSIETTTTTKIDLTGGKHVKVTGCVEAGPDGGFVLTNVADKSSPFHRYMLVSNSDFFAHHVGNRVEVEGRAADRKHGWASIEQNTTSTDGTSSHVQTNAREDASTMRYLGADHMKMVSASCP